MLSCCGARYGFTDPDDDNVRAIPRKVLEGLALISCMLCCLVVDLNAEWTPFATASDGAESLVLAVLVHRALQILCANWRPEAEYLTTHSFHLIILVQS